MARLGRISVVGACLLSAATALWLHAGTGPVVDAAPTPGLLELVASLLAAAWPSLPVSQVLSVWHHAAIAIAVATAVLSVWQLTRSLVAALSVGLIAAATPWMAPTLAPPDATALAVVGATACAVLAGAGGAALVGLLIAGAIAPALILPNVLLGAWVVRGRDKPLRRLTSLAASASAGVVAAALVWAVPPLPGQIQTAALAVSFRPVRDLAPSFDAIVSVLAVLGPAGLALALFGAFGILFYPPSLARGVDPRDRRIVVFGFAAAGLAAALFDQAIPGRALAPLVVALWLLLGSGLAAIVDGPRGWRKLSAVALAAVAVAVRIGPVIDPPPSVTNPQPALGHATLARRNFQLLAYAIPPGAAVVTDDAITDILWRSLSRSLRRSRTAISVVPRHVDEVSAALTSRRVFALPRAQYELQKLGVQFSGTQTLPVPLAQVAAVIPCGRVSTAWGTITPVAGTLQTAFVVTDDAARGPIVIYHGSLDAISVAAVGWPALATRGFYTRSYDLRNPESRRSLFGEIETDGAPAADAVFTAPFVARTEMWRVPGAPRSLSFETSSPPVAGAGVQLARGTGPVVLCAVFPFAVHKFPR